MNTPKPPVTSAPIDSTRRPEHPADHSRVASRSMPLSDLRTEIGDVEFDPDVVLASLSPYDETSAESASAPEPVTFDNEQPAHAHLETLDYRDRLAAIVSRLESGIADDSSPNRKSEYALVASEILALTGDASRAHAFASQAAQAHPNSRLAQTQARHLAFEAGDLDAVQNLAKNEVETLTDTASRVHWHLWHADYLRVVARDRAAAALAQQSAVGVSPRDAQVALLQLLENFAASEPIDLESVAANSTLSEAFDAIELLARLRGTSQFAESAQVNQAVALMKVASSLAAGDTTAAAQQLSRLSPIPGSENALRWLRASLWLTDEETRQAAANELLELQSVEPTSEVRQALLERSVELHDAELTRRLLDSDVADPDDTATAADELVLALHAFAPVEFIRKRCERLSVEVDYLPLALAAKSLLLEQAATWVEVDAQTRSYLAWAEWLTTISENDTTAAPTGAESDGLSDDLAALTQVLALESSHEQRDWQSVAQLVMQASDDSGPWMPGDRETICALFNEAAKNSQAALKAWQDTLEVCPLREAALRATLETTTPADKCSRLEAIATQIDVQDERAVWLLIESALADAQSNHDQADRLLQHAHAFDPTLVIPIIIGEDLARKHVQPSRAVDWISKRAEHADEANESALIAVQEALLQWHRDDRGTESSLRVALENVADDGTLRELFEHLAPAAAANAMQDSFRPAASDLGSIELLCRQAARSAWLGDWQAAHEAATALDDAGASTVGALWAEQAVESGQPYPKLFDRLFSQARAESDPIAQRELYERLARLDSNAASEGNFELWQNAIIERTPGHLPALRVLERTVARRKNWQELAIIAHKLMQQLSHDEALGYCWLAATLYTYLGNWAAREPFVEWAAHQDSPPLWSLRRWYAHVQAKKEWKSMHELECRLAKRSTYFGDTTALLLRSAESAQQMQRPDLATKQLREALDLSPDHVVVLSMWSTHHFQQGDLATAAEGFEQLAQISANQEHRKMALSHAAELWLSLNDEARAECTLELLLTADPLNSFAISKLTQTYRATQAYDRLAALLERQIEHVTDPSERTSLQIERARCLLALGLTIAADKAIAPVLSAFPNHQDALEIKAAVAAALDDVAEAETIYTDLLNLSSEPERQAALCRKLGEIYEKAPDRSDAAESIYRRLLELQPSDAHALSVLVELALRRNDSTEAIRLQNQLVETAKEPAEQRQRFIELAHIYESAVSDRRRAEEVLERARRKWQSDSVVLRAYAEFYQRVADGPALQVLLDRSATEARRALHTGRFELSLFEVLATVASLRQERQAAEAADAVVSALHGRRTSLRGAGHMAFDPRHDESLAPEVLNLPLRAMLQHTGWILDSVSPIDLRAHDVVSLSQVHPSLNDRTLLLAEQFDLQELQVWVSNATGFACVPVQSRPPTLLVGRALVDSSNDSVVDFLLIRAMKIVQSHMTGLARKVAVDLGPLIAAYLSLFLPDWQPTSVDLKKVEELKRQLAQALPNAQDHDIGPLAQDVVVALGNRASQLGEAVNEWGSRTALLALGDPAIALEAIATSIGSSPIPVNDPTERVKWIARHPEARNTIVFAVSDPYLRLRTLLI